MRKITVSFVFGFSFNFHARLTECFNFLADFPSLWLKAGYLWKRICKRKSERNNDNGWTARGQYHPFRNYIITITPIFHLGPVLFSLLSHLNLFFTCDCYSPLYLRTCVLPPCVVERSWPGGQGRARLCPRLSSPRKITITASVTNPDLNCHDAAASHVKRLDWIFWVLDMIKLFPSLLKSIF